MELAFLLPALLLYFACAATVFLLTSKKPAGQCGVLTLASGFCALILFLFAILGLAGVSCFAAFRGVYLTLAGTSAVGVALAFLLQKRCADASAAVALKSGTTVGIPRDGGSRHMAVFALRLFVTLIAVEVLICNSACYARVWKGSPTVPLGLGENVSVSGATAVKTENGATEYRLKPDGKQVVLLFENIGTPMGTLAFFFDTDAETVDYSVDFTDETNVNFHYRTGTIKGTVYTASEQSRYLVTETSGKIGQLRVTFTLPKGTETFTLSDGCLTLNAQIPFRFSPLRVLLVYFLILAMFLLIRAKVFREEFSLRPAAAARMGILLVAGFVVIGIFLCALRSSGWYNDWHLTTGNQMTKELVDAFKAGQTHLLREPSRELLELDNPYDWSQRKLAGVSAAWDHLLFDGKYYSYYGIAPVVLLFLPYHLLTGFYFPSSWAVCLFGIMGIIFIGLIWHVFVRKFLKQIPLGMYVGGLVMLELVSGVWYCFGVTNFYEIASVAGFGFMTMGAYFLLSSNVIGEGKISFPRLAISATALSLSVLSRPTEAIWCVVALLFLFFGLRKHLATHREASRRSRVCSVIAYLSAALLPYVILGLVQMWYNYVRFGSILEFGIRYSLTINDFTHEEFGFRSMMIGYWNYLFAPPSFTDAFPFIDSTFTKLDLNGYYFVAGYNAVGILFRALPVFSLFAAPKLLRLVEDKAERTRAALIGTAVSVIAPAIMIFPVWQYGYCVRYALDFFWEITICALGLCGLYLIRCKNKQLKGILYTVFCVTVLLSFLVSFALYFRFCVANSSAVGFDLFGRLFAFWVS